MNRLCSALAAHSWPSRKAESASGKLLLVGDYELGYVVAAHAVDRSGRARSYRVGKAARMLGVHGDRPTGTAPDSALVVKGIGVAELKDEARVLRGTRKDDGGSSFDAKGSLRIRGQLPQANKGIVRTCP